MYEKRARNAEFAPIRNAWWHPRKGKSKFISLAAWGLLLALVVLVICERYVQWKEALLTMQIRDEQQAKIDEQRSKISDPYELAVFDFRNGLLKKAVLDLESVPPDSPTMNQRSVGWQIFRRRSTMRRKRDRLHVLTWLRKTAARE
jgi:hypothetical protein